MERDLSVIMNKRDRAENFLFVIHVLCVQIRNLGKLPTSLSSGSCYGVTWALVALVRMMQQDGNRSCWFPFIAPITPRGAPSTTYHTPQPPDPWSLSFSSVTSLISSILTIRSSRPVWNTVFILTVLFTCVTRLSHLHSCQTLSGRLGDLFGSLCQFNAAGFSKTNVTVCLFSRRSSLTCPHCLKQSNTFDPFLCISLPIPLRQTRWAVLVSAGRYNTLAQTKTSQLLQY